MQPDRPACETERGKQVMNLDEVTVAGPRREPGKAKPDFVDYVSVLVHRVLARHNAGEFCEECPRVPRDREARS